MTSSPEGRQEAAALDVKALEWRNGYRDENVNIVQASFGGLYQVRIRKDGIWLDWPDRRASEQHHTIEAAKAAAQADYETRIRSTLIPAKPAVEVVERIAEILMSHSLVDAPKDMADNFRALAEAIAAELPALQAPATPDAQTEVEK